MKDELVADFGIASPQVSAAAAFVILILSGFSSPHCGATVYHSDGSAASVQALHNAAHDGDTITVPGSATDPKTFSWTQRVVIKKGITLQGATTVQNPGIDAASPDTPPKTTAVDATTITDGVTDRTGLILMDVPAGKVACVTGLTFKKGSLTGGAADNGVITVNATDATNSKGNRIDNNHFVSSVMAAQITVYNGYGVADHNFFEQDGQRYVFILREQNSNGTTNGNGTWADYPWFGTDKFFFIETNTIIRIPGSTIFTCSDSLQGGKWVARYNYVNTNFGGHGTEGGYARGMRANEYYNNLFNHSSAAPSLNYRSGTGLIHDNVRIGTAPQNAVTISNYRQTPARAFPLWGVADGTSVWDTNATKADGTFTEGDPPYLFDSGTDDSSVDSKGVVHDSTKNWPASKWTHYSIRNVTCSRCNDKVTPPADTEAMGSFIESNTSSTVGYYFYSAGDTGAHLIFNKGDKYEIHKVIRMMDQVGAGKTDLIKVVNGMPINTTTNSASYAHSAIEPMFMWNNVYKPTGAAWNLGGPNAPSTIKGRDYFILANGQSGTPQEVKDYYNAARNGVQYNGPYQYPHPLVSGAPPLPTPTPGPSTPPPSATPRSQQHLQKRKKNSKKLKRRNWPKKSASDMAERLARGSHLVTARRCSHGAVRRSARPAPNDVNAPQGRGYNIC